MSLNIEQKRVVVSEVQASLQDAQAVAFAEYRGLTVSQITQLRRKGQAANVMVRVVKNTLMHRAVEGTSFSPVQPHLTGPLLFGCSADPVALAKLLVDGAKDSDKLVIKVGAMGGKLMSVSQLDQLAKLPSRDQLLGQLMGTMQAPVSTFVRTLNEVPARFVRTLAALRDQKAA